MKLEFLGIFLQKVAQFGLVNLCHVRAMRRASDLNELYAIFTDPELRILGE
jgi:hypothetical protein